MVSPGRGARRTTCPSHRSRWRHGSGSSTARVASSRPPCVAGPCPRAGGTSRRPARCRTARHNPVSRPARRAAWRASRGESSPASRLARRCPPRPSREGVSGGDPVRSAAGMRWDPDMAPVAMPRGRSRDRHRQRLMSFRSLPLPSISRDPRLGHASRTYASRKSASPSSEAPACRYPWRSRWHAMTSVSAGPSDFSPASSHGVADGASQRPSFPRMVEVPAARIGRGTKDFHIARAPRLIRAVLRMGVVLRWGDYTCFMHG